MAEKPKRRELFTLDYWYRTLVRALHAFGAGCLGPLGAHQVNLVGSVPWYGILTSGGIGAAISIFTSMTTIRLEEADEEIRELEREHTRRVLQQQVSPEKPIGPAADLPYNIGREEDMGKHTRPEPTDKDSLITDIPPPRRQPMSPQTPGGPPLREPAPQQVSRTQYETPEGWQPPSPPKPVEPQTDPKIEEWPQGGRRGRHSRGT